MSNPKGRPKLPYVPRYCIRCGKRIEKTMSLRFYYITEYCSVECKIADSMITKECSICGEKFKVKPYDHKTVRCESCRNAIKQGAKPCACCGEFIYHHSPLHFGRHEYCSIRCMVEHLGNQIRFCINCKLPLVSKNGSTESYNNTTKHQNCEMFKLRIKNMATWSKKKMEEYENIK